MVKCKISKDSNPKDVPELKNVRLADAVIKRVMPVIQGMGLNPEISIFSSYAGEYGEDYGFVSVEFIFYKK